MSGLAQFARARAVERLKSVNKQRLRVLSSPAEDPVHDLRVALRRLEQVFELFGGEPLGFDSAQAQRHSKDWLRAAGRVRDCDVVMPLLHAPWTNDLHAYRKERAQELAVALGDRPMPAPHPRALRLSQSSEEVARFARIALPREAAKYFKAGARAAQKRHSLRRLHEFRLHGKSLRYAIEIFEPLYGPRLKQLTKLLKRAQQVLGEMADARAAVKLLKQMNAPETVIQPLRKLAHDKRDAFAARWLEEVPNESVASRWVEYLRRYASAEPRKARLGGK